MTTFGDQLTANSDGCLFPLENSTEDERYKEVPRCIYSPDVSSWEHDSPVTISGFTYHPPSVIKKVPLPSGITPPLGTPPPSETPSGIAPPLGTPPPSETPSGIAPQEVVNEQGQKRPINIVITGKVGTGKSTLRRNIFPKDGDDEDDVNKIISPDHITNDYATHDYEQHGVSIKITDTIGLEGSKGKIKGKLKSLAKYMKKHGNVDLLIHCIPVDPSSKFIDTQPDIMQSLQDAFDHNIWKHCIIVFTFSNQALSRIKEKLKGNDDKAKEIYKKHINDFTDKVRAELIKLHVQQVSVKTMFDLPLEAPQIADHTTIMAIPAGDNPEDQVLPGIQYELQYKDQEDLPLKWTDVLFNEIVKLSKAEHKNSLLRYRYGTDWARMKAKAAAGTLSGAVGGSAIGAAIGGGIGVLGGPIGIAVGAGVGGVMGMITGLASGGAVSEQVTKK